MNEEERVLKNISLVKKIAWNIYKTNGYITNCIDINDLIQTGTEGLIYAANKYKQRTNKKFSTYAYICIKGYILNEIYKMHPTPLDILRTKERKTLYKKVSFNDVSLHELMSINTNYDYTITTNWTLTQKNIELEESLNRLSKRAKYVINLILNYPEEILSIAKTKIAKDKITKYKIIRFLRKNGWSFPKIQKTINEIKTCLT